MTPAWALPSEAALSTARQAPGAARPQEERAEGLPLPDTLASSLSLLGRRTCGLGCELGLGAEGPRASGKKPAWAAHLEPLSWWPSLQQML